MANRPPRHSEQKDHSYGLLHKLPHFAEEAIFLIAVTLILAISVAGCEVIITLLVRFIEWFSGHKLPEWFHTTLISILCLVLIALALFIAYMHVKGMKAPPAKEEFSEDLSLFPKDE